MTGQDIDRSWLSLDEMLEHSNQRASKLYKWARVNGEFRFIHLIFHEHHGMLINGETEMDKVSSAGTISVAEDYWRVTDRDSRTLKYPGCSAEDESALEKALAAAGREFKQRGL